MFVEIVRIVDCDLLQEIILIFCRSKISTNPPGSSRTSRSYVFCVTSLTTGSTRPLVQHTWYSHTWYWYPHTWYPHTWYSHYTWYSHTHTWYSPLVHTSYVLCRLPVDVTTVDPVDGTTIIMSSRPSPASSGRNPGSSKMKPMKRVSASTKDTPAAKRLKKGADENILEFKGRDDEELEEEGILLAEEEEEADAEALVQQGTTDASAVAPAVALAAVAPAQLAKEESDYVLRTNNMLCTNVGAELVGRGGLLVWGGRAPVGYVVASWEEIFQNPSQKRY